MSDEDKRVEELSALVGRAQEGDESAMPALRELFVERPEAVDLLGGDLAGKAQTALIGKYCGKNLLVKEALVRKLDALRAELLAAGGTPLERLLADRVVACWLHLHHLEAIYGRTENITLELGSYYQRCISASQKRYLSAIKTLATVRKLAVPVLQVNIARRQVNVAGACPAVVADGPSEK